MASLRRGTTVNAGFGGRQAKAKPATADVMHSRGHAGADTPSCWSNWPANATPFPAISIAPAAGIAWQQDLGKYNRLNNELAADGAFETTWPTRPRKTGRRTWNCPITSKIFLARLRRETEMSKGAQNGRQVLSSEELQRNQNATRTSRDNR